MMLENDNSSQDDIDKMLNDLDASSAAQKSAPQSMIDDMFAPTAMGQTDGSSSTKGGGGNGGGKDGGGKEGGGPETHELEAVYDVPVQISAVLGRSIMPVHQLLKLGRGAIVELDRRVGEAIDIYVNNRLVARGEVVVVDDRLGVTMTEIIKSERS